MVHGSRDSQVSGTRSQPSRRWPATHRNCKLTWLLGTVNTLISSSSPCCVSQSHVTKQPGTAGNNHNNLSPTCHSQFFAPTTATAFCLCFLTTSDHASCVTGYSSRTCTARMRAISRHGTTDTKSCHLQPEKQGYQETNIKHPTSTCCPVIHPPTAMCLHVYVYASRAVFPQSHALGSQATRDAHNDQSFASKKICKVGVSSLCSTLSSTSALAMRCLYWTSSSKQPHLSAFSRGATCSHKQMSPLDQTPAMS